MAADDSDGTVDPGDLTAPSSQRDLTAISAAGGADIQGGGLAAETLRFIDAAMRRGMPFDVLPSSVQIGWGANAERFDLTFTGRTSWIAAAIAKNKLKASQMLGGAGWGW